MHSFDQTNADLTLYAFKEGLLSAMGHDLKITAEVFSIHVAPDGHTEVRVDGSALTPVCAMRNGKEAPGTLSPRDLKKITEHLLEDILETSHFPTIAFSAPPEALSRDTLVGTLTLKGVSGPVKLKLKVEGQDIIAQGTIHQPDYDIRPFQSMMGALKVNPEVQFTARLKGAASSLEAVTDRA